MPELDPRVRIQRAYTAEEMTTWPTALLLDRWLRWRSGAVGLQDPAVVEANFGACCVEINRRIPSQAPRAVAPEAPTVVTCAHGSAPGKCPCPDCPGHGGRHGR